MQYCRYDAARDNLEEEIKRLTDNGFISAIQAQALNRDKLSELFSSDFAKRMFSSDRIYRELKVEAFVPLNELEDSEFDDPVLIQGIADCVFEEDGQLVLVDYKTDYVKEENDTI
jgi:ATP-dependent helicase/nuclease subunit A